MKNEDVFGIIVALLAIVLSLICLAGCAETAQIKDPVYDPNAPELQYILATDPNWARDYGDTRETRVLMNVSANRGMALQNRNVLAEVAKRLIAMEAWQKEQPVWDGNDIDDIVLLPMGIDTNTVDPNEVKE